MIPKKTEIIKYKKFLRERIDPLTNTMTTLWVSNSCGALFIFSDVVLNPELDDTEAFEDWYCLNDIEKITKVSVTNVLWGELTQTIKVIKPEVPWKTEEPDYVEFEPK